MKTKKCSCCNNVIDIEMFRVRLDKRHGLIYHNNTCKQCDAKKARIYYNENKNLNEFKEKAKNRSRKSYYKNRERNLVKQKEYRSKPKNKIARRDYVRQNSQKIKSQEIITKKRYHEKNRDGLTDTYVVKQLKQSTGLPKEAILEYPQLIECKRLQLKTIRLIKQKT